MSSNSNESSKIIMMRLNKTHLDLTTSQSLDKADLDKPLNDLVLYVDSASMQNAPASFVQLVERINQSLELDTTRKKLDLDEKKLQLALLEEEKNAKIELNKYDLLERSLDLKKKTSELEYTSKLRELTLEAIQSNDYHKASYLNLCLHKPQPDVFNSYLSNNLTSSSYVNSASQMNELNHVNMNTLSDDESINEDTTSNNTNLGYNLTNGAELGEVMNVIPNDETNTIHLEENDIENDLEPKTLVEKQLFNFKPVNGTSPVYKLSLANKNIRHLICSTSKLEDYCNSSALAILYKGKCHESEICHRKESHTHYLIDCTNCRRHISLYFQTSKYGLKFYKTYQIKSQAELDKIIRTFRMRSIKE